MKDFNRLYEELTPLKRSLASTVNYRALRFTFEDILGFLDDKLIHVYLKYQDTHEYDEIKAIAIASLQNVRGKIYARYGKETSLDINPEMAEDPYYEMPNTERLIDNLNKVAPKEIVNLARIMVDPPVFILNKVSDLSKRIPSKLFLEFYDIPVNKANIKRFNTMRRTVRDLIVKHIDSSTFDLKKDVVIS